MRDQTEEQVSRRSLLRRAALLVGLGSVGALAVPAAAGATTRTGWYIGNGNVTQVLTGLAVVRAFRIVSVPAHGPSVEAFTTNTIQLFNGPTALVNGKRDDGVSLEAGNFTVTNPDLNEIGVVYHWVADGD